MTATKASSLPWWWWLFFTLRGTVAVVVQRDHWRKKKKRSARMYNEKRTMGGTPCIVACDDREQTYRRDSKSSEQWCIIPRAHIHHRTQEGPHWKGNQRRGRPRFCPTFNLPAFGRTRCFLPHTERRGVHHISEVWLHRGRTLITSITIIAQDISDISVVFFSRNSLHQNPGAMPQIRGSICYPHS